MSEMYPEAPIHTKGKLLEQLKVGMQVLVDRRMAERELPPFVAAQAKLHIGPAMEAAGDRLVMQLRSYVLADHVVAHTQEIEHYVPATWWQHFKFSSRLWRHTPLWVRRRWPVKMERWTRTVSFDHYLTYPQTRILPRNDMGRPVIYERFGPGLWEPR